MANVVIVKQEDTTDTIRVSPYPVGEATFDVQPFGNPGGWKCRSVVIPEIHGPIIVDKEETTISADNLYFECTLEPEHTRILDNKTYIWVIELENDQIVPYYRKEYHVQLVVEENAAINTSLTDNIYNIESIGTVANSFNDRKVIVVDQLITIPFPLITVKLLDEDGKIIQTTFTRETRSDITQFEVLEDVCLEPVQVNLIQGEDLF